MVLGYDTVEAYETNSGYLGAVIGRYCNRIARGRLTVDGAEYRLAVNNGQNHLHGGVRGFDKYVWAASETEDGVLFSRISPDGEEGYPGTLYTRVTYTLSDDNALYLSYEAFSDRDTVVNLTNHVYFNLNGGGSALTHVLTVPADRYCEAAAPWPATGNLPDVASTPFDFRQPKPIGRDINLPVRQLAEGDGYDLSYALGAAGEMKTAAVLTSPQTGVTMTVSTTLPAMQLYTANHLTERIGKNGQIYRPRDAVCLETQFHPDTPNQPAFPSCLLRQGERYRHTNVYRFTTDESHGMMP